MQSKSFFTLSQTTNKSLQPFALQNTDNSALAGFRTSISFVGLDNTADRGVLFRAAKLNGCDGGISPKIYKKLVDAAAAAKYDIKYNREFHLLASDSKHISL